MGPLFGRLSYCKLRGGFGRERSVESLFVACGDEARYTLQCPCHEWKYDITTGEFLDARVITVPTYRCKSEDGKVLVELEER